MESIDLLRGCLLQGLVIPACPLALTASRTLDERYQRGLIRYYRAAGAGGVAVGVHTTQFAIRDPKIDLFKPVMQLAADELRNGPLARIGGICGETRQATSEATLLCDLGYHAGLLSLAALQTATEDDLISHCETIAQIIPIIGFYLQAAVGGRVLPYSFWRRFVEIDRVVAIKIAPFNRYQTLDVIRALADSGRTDIALYTGNDDNILLDLLTPFRFQVNGATVERRIVGGLLGHWSIWTHQAVQLHRRCREVSLANLAVSPDLLALNSQVTDCNAAFFDAANHYAGCIPGLHEILRRQGLLQGNWCLNPGETLSPGQLHEINRVCSSYPHLQDNDFVAQNRDEWLR